MKLRARRRFTLSTLVALFAAVLLLAVWAGVAGMLASKRASDIADEFAQNRNLSRALTEQTLRVFAAIDQATIRTRNAVASGQDPVDLVRFANETGLVPGILVQLSLVDAHGRFVGSNLDPDGSKSQHVDLSSREHVRVHLQAPAGAVAAVAPDGLFIGKPVLGKVSGRWTIQLSRRIAAADGRPLGVVVASLDPSYFEEVYRGVSIGRSGAVALVGADLGLRARVLGGRSIGMGSSLGSGTAFSSHLRDNEGQYRALGAVDGLERVFAFHRVGPYPVFVNVSTAVDEALQDWRETRNVMVALALLLSAVVVAATASFVTGLRRLERSHEALRASEARAQAANQAKTEFLAAISHELRTPLTSIRGFAELLEHRLDDARFREKAGLIRKGAERLNGLLTDILDMTRLEAGALQLTVEAVELRPLVEAARELFQVAAAHKGLVVQAQVDPDVPLMLAADSLRLRQILHNLLSNAIKFTPSGQVTLQVQRQAGELQFHVIDSGPGIAPELRDAIFEMFRQGSGHVSYEHGGTGLGLALSRALALLMHGRLELLPAERGAHFVLAVPLTLAPSLPRPPASAPAADEAVPA